MSFMHFVYSLNINISWAIPDDIDFDIFNPNHRQINMYNSPHITITSQAVTIASPRVLPGPPLSSQLPPAPHYQNGSNKHQSQVPQRAPRLPSDSPRPPTGYTGQGDGWASDINTCNGELVIIIVVIGSSIGSIGSANKSRLLVVV